MDEKTKVALDACIEKWKLNLLAMAPDQAHIYKDTCALCTIYYNTEPPYCKGCPVAERSGYYGCTGTPWMECRSTYLDWKNYYISALTSGRSDDPHVDRYRGLFRAAAQKEIDFLESLRVKEHVCTSHQ